MELCKNSLRSGTSTKSMTPEIASTMCDKTAAIRAMFAEVECEHKTRLKARLTPAKRKLAMKAKGKGAMPDWNKIHSKQMFQR